MDDRRFEALTRALAQAPTRRRVLSLLAAGILAPWRSGAARGSQPACAPGLSQCCESCPCVDLLSDLEHCGACFTPCESGLVAVACRGGQCVRDQCSPGLTYCGPADLCRDVSSDPLHCGGCGNACASGVCNGGVCAAMAVCEPGFTACGAMCVALASDPFHCGACFNACAGVPPPGQSSIGACVDGICRVVCEPGFVACGGRCIDLSADPANCGTCGNVCARNAGCRGGDCICDAGFTFCPGTGACFDFARDAAHCGGCGFRCAEAEACRDGACGAAAMLSPASDASVSMIGWPFDPDDGGVWAISNGYRGEGSHALRSDGSANAFLYALDFVRRVPNRIDKATGICRLATGGMYGDSADGAGWDETATQDATVLSPVDGTIVWVDESDPPCLGFGIAIDGSPGYRLALFHVAGDPRSGPVRRGEPIGTVAEGGCGPGNRIEMVLYEVGDDPADPAAERRGVPFAGEWAIAGCAYPDDKRTNNQYRGELVPCRAGAAGSVAT